MATEDCVGSTALPSKAAGHLVATEDCVGSTALASKAAGSKSPVVYDAKAKAMLEGNEHEGLERAWSTAALQSEGGPSPGYPRVAL